MNLFSTFKLFIPIINNKPKNIEAERIVAFLVIVFLPIFVGSLPIFDDACNVPKLKL